MNIKLRIIALTLFPILLSGCATITKDKTQMVSVSTTCANKDLIGANCSLHNEHGTWQVFTPNSVQIHKAYNDLLVNCTNGQSSASKTIESSANGGAWGNFLFGGVIGYITDKENGAGFDYPPMLTLDLDDCNANAK